MGNTCGIGCAVADSPAGPFTNQGKLFRSNEIGVQNSIDPFYIEENGEKYLLKDLIKELETSIIIVADGGLGTINSTLLTVEYARANNIPIAGIILNNFNPDSFMHQDNLKQVEYLTGIKVVATVERGQKDIKLLEELWTGRKKI